MKKWGLWAVLLLAGCSLDPDAADKYVTEPPLEAALQVTSESVRIQTDPAAYVTAKWWQQGKSPADLPLKQEASGLYTAEKTWTEDGVYFVQAIVKTNGQQAMPIQKIVVGDVKEPEEKVPEANGHSHH